MLPATSPCSSVLDGDIGNEGTGLFPPAHGYILASSCLAAEIYQHDNTALAG